MPPRISASKASVFGSAPVGGLAGVFEDPAKDPKPAGGGGGGGGPDPKPAIGGGGGGGGGPGIFLKVI